MIRGLLVFFAVACLSSASSAQEIRVVDGRKYMVHTVQAGQTLYAISRSFAVPLDAIIGSNPGVERGLSIDQEILIPQDEVVRKLARRAPELQDDGELKHSVKRKETLFGISKLYGVDINKLMERNPQTLSGIQPGMEVIIPVVKYQGQSDAASRPAIPLNTMAHVVMPGETLFALGKKFNVTPDQIKEVNDGLPAGLKAGDTVYIPVQPVTGKPFVGDTATIVKEVIPSLQKYRIAFLLPFAVPKNDSLLASNVTNPHYYEPSRIAAQFYAGARIALDSLQKIGLNAEVIVKDMGDDQKTWTAVMRDPDIARTDLFIGPFHRTAVEQMARLATRAHIVCPVPQSVRMILGNPNVSKITPTRTDLVRHAARYVAQRHSRDNIVIVRSDVASELNQQEHLESAMQEAISLQRGRLRDTVLVARVVKRDLKGLISKLDASKMNVLVTSSDDVEFATALTNVLKQNVPKYKITLVGMPSWLENASIASADLDLLGFMFPSSSFADPSDERLQRFTKKFRDLYHTDVDEYALLGFDATFFYVDALMTQGKQFPTHFARVRTEPLFTGFRMTHTGPENGFRNEYAIMLRQKGLQLVKAP